MPVAGIGRGRAGRAEAAADDVRADDEEAVGVDDLAGTDQHLPPARLAGHRIGVGDMLVAGQRMADQDGVGLARVVERAVGLVGDLERRQQHAGVELERLVGAEAQHRARSGRRPRCRLLWRAQRPSISSIHCSSRIAAGDTKNRHCLRKAGYRCKRSFSELFNVAASRPAKSPRNCRCSSRTAPPFASTGKLC